MGINSKYYTVYGIKHDSYYEELEDLADERKIHIIQDGMCGEYCVIGQVLFDSGDQRYGDIKDEFVEINIGDLDKIREDYSAKFREALPEFEHLLYGEWQLMTFLHQY